VSLSETTPPRILIVLKTFTEKQRQRWHDWCGTHGVSLTTRCLRCLETKCLRSLSRLHQAAVVSHVAIKRLLQRYRWLSRCARQAHFFLIFSSKIVTHLKQLGHDWHIPLIGIYPIGTPPDMIGIYPIGTPPGASQSLGQQPGNIMPNHASVTCWAYSLRFLHVGHIVSGSLVHIRPLRVTGGRRNLMHIGPEGT